MQTQGFTVPQQIAAGEKPADLVIHQPEEAPEIQEDLFKLLKKLADQEAQNKNTELRIDALAEQQKSAKADLAAGIIELRELTECIAKEMNGVAVEKTFKLNETEGKPTETLEDGTPLVTVPFVPDEELAKVAEENPAPAPTISDQMAIDEAIDMSKGAIKGLGPVGKQRLIELCPTVAQFVHVYKQASLDGNPLHASLPKGVGEDTANALVDAFMASEYACFFKSESQSE